MRRVRARVALLARALGWPLLIVALVALWFVASGVYLMDKGRLRGVTRGSLEHKNLAPGNDLFARLTDHRPSPEDKAVAFGEGGPAERNPLA